jgi:acyl dehydratase
VGLPDPILHGTATLALAVKELLTREPGGTPRGLKALRCRFTAMVLLNSSVRVQLLTRKEGSRGAELFFQVLTEAGEKAVSRGQAVLTRA